MSSVVNFFFRIFSLLSLQTVFLAKMHLVSLHTGISKAKGHKALGLLFVVGRHHESRYHYCCLFAVELRNLEFRVNLIRVGRNVLKAAVVKPETQIYPSRDN